MLYSDFAGPILQWIDNRWEQIGITNYPRQELFNSWSMIVSIRQRSFEHNTNGIHGCDGTILNEWYVLTTAYCLDMISFELYNQSILNHTSRTIDRIIIHPLWKQGKQFSNDTALIRLSEALDFQTNPYISRTCRSPQMNSIEQIFNYPLNGTLLIATGWGTAKNGTSAEILQQVGITSYATPFCALHDWIESIINPDYSSTSSTTTQKMTKQTLSPITMNSMRPSLCGCGYFIG
ncbi:hypothetical protein I4U23_027025 [Adineta vaga]|nr:hypothetical protein I4U23_027025 [Adineta vaga]